MKMGAELRKSLQRACEFPCDNPRLQGSQPDPLKSRYLMDTLDQGDELSAVPVPAPDRAALHALRPIGAQMDACENRLLIPLFCQGANLVLHVLGAAASHPPSGIGDNTVTAKLVAAVLNLYKGPGVLSPALQPQGLAAFLRCDVLQVCA